MKATTEIESMKHMEVSFARNGKLSGNNAAWTETKTKAMRAIYQDFVGHRGVALRMLDFGIGDMMYLDRWEDFNRIMYMGVDGCAPIVATAIERYPELEFVLSTFGDFLSSDLQDPLRVDLVAAVDVLYHIPENSVHDDLVDYLLSRTGFHRYVLLSFATDPAQTFDGATGPGGNGYSWFPRGLHIPNNWKVLYTEDQPAGMEQKQRLVALVRS
jgi:hypothetical protein